MKRVLGAVIIFLTIWACKEEPKDYVTLSGTLTNQNSDLLIVAQREILKTIKVDAEGKFSDTLKVESGNYILFDGKNRINLYLENGYDLQITVDTNQLLESLNFEGYGPDANNYIAQKKKVARNLIDYNALMAMEKADLDKKLANMVAQFEEALDKTEGLDSVFIA